MSATDWLVADIFYALGWEEHAMRFEADDEVTFRYSGQGDSLYRSLNGKDAVVVRPLRVPEEADEEVGPMYKIRFMDGRAIEISAFEDELSQPHRTYDDLTLTVLYRHPAQITEVTAYEEALDEHVGPLLVALKEAIEGTGATDVHVFLGYESDPDQARYELGGD